MNAGRPSDGFILILSGGCTYTFADHAFDAVRGDIIYLANRDRYAMSVHSEETYSFIYCDFEFSPPRCGSAVYTPKNPKAAEKLFRRLLSLHSSRGGSHAECMSLLYSIYALMCESVVSDYVAHGPRERIIRSREEIDSSFSDPEISVASLAERAGMSEVYYRRLFRKVVGMSPSEYITSVRIRAACDLLKYPFMTVSECAAQTGYNTVQYFSRVFRKALDKTPAEYRREWARE